jgi:hypothetical protein
MPGCPWTLSIAAFSSQLNPNLLAQLVSARCLRFSGMKRARLQDLSMDELVARFVAIALAQDHAMLHDENAKYRRLRRDG